jgi:hypothetical protein
MKALINVKYSEWLADGERFPGGSQEITVSDELVPLLAHAIDAGVVELEDAPAELEVELRAHVEPQEESEAKLAEAMGEWVPPAAQEDGTTVPGYWTGPWYEGHLALAALDAARSSAEIAIDVEPAEAS